MLKRKRSFEQKLIERLGFSVTICETDEFLEIIGIATKSERSNFYIQILTNSASLNQEDRDQHAAKIKQYKKHFPIEIDFLVSNVAYGPKENTNFLENAFVIQALIQVTDPQNEYKCLGPIALYLHENQLQKTSIAAVTKELQISKQHLQQSPFLKFDWLSKEFSFIIPKFRDYYIGKEFSKFHQTQYKEKLHQGFNDNIKEFIDYSAAPPKLIEVRKLFEKVAMRKKEMISKSYYETAAWIRDAEYRLFDKWIVPYWWDYSNLDIENVEQEINTLLIHSENR